MSDNKEENNEAKPGKKLADEEKKRLTAKLQKEMEFYEYLEKSRGESEETHQKEFDFKKGILYAIFYGFMTNLLVQYSFSLCERIASATYDTMYWASVLLVSGSFIVLVVATIKITQDMENEARKIRKAWTSRVAAELTKEDLKRLLKYLKCQ